MDRVWLIAAAVFVGVLLLASILLALLKGNEELEEGLPGRTVQLHLQAFEADDYKTAHVLLSEELKQECLVEEYASHNISANERMRDSRVSLEETNDLDGLTVVIARVSRIRAGRPFGTSESSFRITYTLVREEGEWRFRAYPWPLSWCGPDKRPLPRLAVPER